MRTDVSRSLRNSPQFAGVSAGSNADVRSLPLAEVAIASILAAGLWGSANPFLARDGVAHEDCEVQIDKPSIAYWRDHSAGASRGITAALPGKITFKDGRVEQTNFDTYQKLRMNEAPATQVHIFGIPTRLAGW